MFDICKCRTHIVWRCGFTGTSNRPLTVMGNLARTSSEAFRCHLPNLIVRLGRAGTHDAMAFVPPAFQQALARFSSPKGVSPALSYENKIAACRS
eukprot:6206961-Pleurochrysis_carterae.AAC.1